MLIKCPDKIGQECHLPLHHSYNITDAVFVLMLHFPSTKYAMDQNARCLTFNVLQ